jgi:hypothetical protein
MIEKKDSNLDRSQVALIQYRSVCVRGLHTRIAHLFVPAFPFSVVDEMFRGWQKNGFSYAVAEDGLEVW